MTITKQHRIDGVDSEAGDMEATRDPVRNFSLDVDSTIETYRRIESTN